MHQSVCLAQLLRVVTGSGDGSATLQPRRSGRCRPKFERLPSELQSGRETASDGECVCIGLCGGALGTEQPMRCMPARLHNRALLPLQPAWQCRDLYWRRETERKAIAAWRAERAAAEAALAARSARQVALEQQHSEAVRQLRMAEAKAVLAVQKARQARDEH